MATYVPYAFKDPITKRLRILNAAQADLNFVLECASLQDEQAKKIHEKIYEGIPHTDDIVQSVFLYRTTYIAGVTVYARCFTHGKRSLHDIIAGGGKKKVYYLIDGTDEINKVHDLYMRIRDQQLGHVVGSLARNYICLSISEESTPETVALQFPGAEDLPRLTHKDYDIRIPVNFALSKLSKMITEDQQKIMNYVKLKDMNYLKKWGKHTSPKIMSEVSELIYENWDH